MSGTPVMELVKHLVCRASAAIKAWPSLGLPQVGGLPEFEVPILLKVQASLPWVVHPTLWELLQQL